MSFGLALGVASTIYSMNKADEAADRSNALSGRSLELQEEALDFTKQQYNDWKAIYGPIEKNLSSFYQNLTPEFVEAQGLQAQQKAFQQQEQQLTEFFAANDISVGEQAEILSRVGMENIRQKAEIRANAPIKSAEAKQSFLSLGINQKASTTGAVTNQLSNLSTTLANQASSYDRAAAAGYQAAGTGLQVVADELDQYLLDRPAKASSGESIIE